eukprot:518413-Prorocentrum_minimum.AAC.1
MRSAGGPAGAGGLRQASGAVRPRRAVPHARGGAGDGVGRLGHGGRLPPARAQRRLPDDGQVRRVPGGRPGGVSGHRGDLSIHPGTPWMRSVAPWMRCVAPWMRSVAPWTHPSSASSHLTVLPPLRPTSRPPL